MHDLFAKYPDINKARLLEWADVLESGKYKQMHGGWGGEEASGYCCLHAAYRHFQGHDLPVDKEDWPSNTDLSCSEHVAALFNVSEGNAGSFADQFITMNDEEKFSFSHIAGYIRAELTELNP